MVRMNDLPNHHQPQSEDPDFWDVWTRQAERKVDWLKVAADWQRREHKDDSNNKSTDNGAEEAQAGE